MQPLNKILKEYTKEDIINGVVNYLYKRSEIFNTIHTSDQAIKLLIMGYADDIKELKWIKHDKNN